MIFFVKIFRLLAILFYGIFWTGIVSFIISRQKNRQKAILEMSRQTQKWGKVLLKILNIKVEIHGSLNQYNKYGGLIVSNHLGYVDIFLHASIFGLRFTPKKEIKDWPFLAWVIGLSLPIWIDRKNRQKSQEIVDEIRSTLKAKIPLIIYPEGTSSDGKSGVLPFKSTPFEPIVNTNIPILPIFTCYKVDNKDYSPCWYGDMTLIPHFWKILGNKKTIAKVEILPLIYSENRNRKELANLVNQKISVNV